MAYTTTIQMVILLLLKKVVHLKSLLKFLVLNIQVPLLVIETIPIIYCME